MKVSNEMPSRTGQDSVCALTGRFQSLKGQLIDCSSPQPHIIYFLENCFQRISQNDENTAREGSGRVHRVQSVEQHTAEAPSSRSMCDVCLSSLHITYRS